MYKVITHSFQYIGTIFQYIVESQCGDEIAIIWSYWHNGISYINKMAYFIVIEFCCCLCLSDLLVVKQIPIILIHLKLICITLFWVIYISVALNDW